MLHGNLDAGTTADIERQIQSQVALGYTKIIVDCKGLGFVSSIGIGAQVVLQTRLHKKGGVVKLAGAQGVDVEVIRLAPLDKVIDIYGDFDAARQSFR